LADYFSEPALNRARLHVEVEWLIHLAQTQAVPGVPRLEREQIDYLRSIPARFGPGEIAELGTIERETVHDVKAVEYFLRRRMTTAVPGTQPAADTDDGAGRASNDMPGARGLEALSELIHFACTSEDINNLTYALMVRGATEQVWLPAAQGLTDDLALLAHAQAGLPMLARTHGQGATPTTLGKEIAVTVHRLRRQIARIKRTEYLGKANGATGTYGAHVLAAPDTDWIAVSKGFVESLGLTWNPLTTQIESHDWQAELYADMARFNRIAHNLATDMWTYISLGYFVQARGQGTVGSSTMPHKVNPIRFENAEANLEISSALLDTLGATLVTSRLQRDLTDSTTQRNIGVAMGHSLLALDNLRRGLAGLDVAEDVIRADLQRSPEVLGEPIQSVMRAAALAGTPGMEQPYERLKAFTRGRKVTLPELQEFVRSLGLPDDARDRLLALTPQTYTGLAQRLVEQYLP
jgi:adenylosuccinate lyase